MFDIKVLEEAFSLRKAGITPPAVLCAVQPPRDIYGGIEDAFRKIDAFFECPIEALSVEPVTVPGALWEIELQATIGDVKNTYIIWCSEGTQAVSGSLEKQGMSSFEKSCLNKATRYVGLASLISSAPYEHLKKLYELLFYIEPEVMAFGDMNALQISGVEWVRRSVFSPVELPFSLLCRTSVRDSVLSTTGLSRFDIPELFIYEFSEKIRQGCQELLSRTVNRLVRFGMPTKDEEAFFIGRGVSLLLMENVDTVNGAFLCSSKRDGNTWCSSAIHQGEFEDCGVLPSSPEEARNRRLTAFEYFPDCRKFFKKARKRKLPAEKVTILVGLGDNCPATDAKEFFWYEVKRITSSGFFCYKIRQGADLSAVDRGKLYYFDISFLIDWRIHSGGKIYSPSEAVLV